MKYYSENSILKDFLSKNKKHLKIFLKYKNLEDFLTIEDIKNLVIVNPDILYYNPEYIYRFYNLSKTILLRNSSLTKKIALKGVINKDLLEELLLNKISYINYFNIYYKNMEYQELFGLYLNLRDNTNSIKVERLYKFFDKYELDGFLITNVINLDDFKTPSIRKEIRKKIIDIYK